jgi:predicted enzyme involved in methoxymalonyl-ACP biosynthesis
MGRTVETAVLSQLMDVVRRRGGRTLFGEFRPTAKNAPAAELYRSSGFALVNENEHEQRWRADLETLSLNTPEWFEVSLLEDRAYVG